MDKRKLAKEIIDVCNKYKDGIVTFIFAVSFLNDNNEIEVYGNTLVPVPPKDHEEEILRNNFAKKACELVEDLTKNTYPV